jgi:hypothetical protein
MNPQGADPLPNMVYDFHGVTVALHGDVPAVRLLQARLRSFPRRIEVGEPDLVFEFYGPDAAGRCPPPAARERARPIYDLAGGDVLYSDDRDELYITYDDGVSLVCEAGGRRVSISVLRPQATNQWLASHLFFTIAFCELLKRRARYSVHAAGLCVDGQALLFPGQSGSGKTTLAVALIQAGLDFLGDDMLFLSGKPDGLKVLAFPDELDIAPDAAELVPALHYLSASTPIHGGPKHRVPLEDLQGSPRVWTCGPKVLVFPRIAHTNESRLTPIHADEALLELAPNILLTEPRACQAHLDILGRLARESVCYRLDTGRDFERLPGLLRGLVA